MKRGRRRRYRKNPSSTTWLLLLGAGVGLYYLLRNDAAKKAVAAPGAYVLKRDPSGAPMCFTATGDKAPLSECQHLIEAEQLEGMGNYYRSSIGCGPRGCGPTRRFQG